MTIPARAESTQPPPEPQPQTDPARSESSSGSSGSSSSSGFTSSSNGSGPVAQEVAESSARSGGSRPTHDLDQVPEQDMSWVSSALRGQQSVILKGKPEAARLTTQLANKGWRVVGMERGENIATWTDDVQFTMYRIVYDRMSVVPPFSPFQRRVLKFLQVAPSQLNPNAWAFLQGFEDVMKALNRPYSIKLFFTLLEMSYLYEQGSKGARKEAVSFKNRKQFNFFKPYMESLPTGWKKEFFWVVPYEDEAIQQVAKISQDGAEATTRFPFTWSLNHFKKKPGQYSFSVADLDDPDKETIRMLKRVASLVQGGRIKIKPIVDARGRDQVKDALGGWPPVGFYLCLYFLVIYFFTAFLTLCFPCAVQMTSLNDLDDLERYAAEVNEASPPQGGPTLHADGVEMVAASGPRPGPSPLKAVTPVQAVPHSSPPPTKDGGSKRARSSEQRVEGKKKHKSSSKGHGQARSPRLDLLGLTDQDCARFKEEPFLVVAEMMKSADSLFRRYQEGEADRLAGRRLLQKYSSLEDNLIDKNFKLNSAISMLTEMREERDSLLQRLKELEPQVKSIAANEQKLKEAEEQIMEQVTGRSKAEAALAASEAAKEKAEAALAEKERLAREAEKEIDRLLSLNKRLFAENASMKGDLEKDRETFQVRFKDVVNKAKGAADAQFENALSQLKLLNPDLVIDPQLVNKSHRVDGQEIILPEQSVKGKVVQERAVVFRVPDA